MASSVAPEESRPGRLYTPRRAKALWQRIPYANVITMMAIAVGLASIFVSIFGSPIPIPITRICAEVLASDELTEYPAHGEPGEYRWKLILRFINSGDELIIRGGSRGHVKGEGLNFSFPEGTEIVELQEEGESEAFMGTLAQTESNQFQIQFLQWWPDDYMIATFIITSDEPLGEYPLPEATPEKQIEGGDVVVLDLREKSSSEPIWLRSGKVMGGAFAGLLVIVLILLTFSEWKRGLQLAGWKKNHFPGFLKHLDKVKPTLPPLDKELFKKQPYRLPEVFWAKFKGQKAPVKKPMFDSIAKTIVFTIVSFLMVFSFICIIFMLLSS